MQQFSFPKEKVIKTEVRKKQLQLMGEEEPNTGCRCLYGFPIKSRTCENVFIERSVFGIYKNTYMALFLCS
jgi:hypothetical protein